jgi:hypothetical protein
LPVFQQTAKRCFLFPQAWPFGNISGLQAPKVPQSLAADGAKGVIGLDSHLVDGRGRCG